MGCSSRPVGAGVGSSTTGPALRQRRSPRSSLRSFQSSSLGARLGNSGAGSLSAASCGFRRARRSSRCSSRFARSAAIRLLMRMRTASDGVLASRSDCTSNSAFSSTMTSIFTMPSSISRGVITIILSTRRRPRPGCAAVSLIHVLSNQIFYRRHRRNARRSWRTRIQPEQRYGGEYHHHAADEKR